MAGSPKKFEINFVREGGARGAAEFEKFHSIPFVRTRGKIGRGTHPCRHRTPLFPKWHVGMRRSRFKGRVRSRVSIVAFLTPRGIGRSWRNGASMVRYAFIATNSHGSRPWQPSAILIPTPDLPFHNPSPEKNAVGRNS